ncbi:hypothetical protein B0H14DRAFT_2570566 [Mycena olivaceomarginata]|nr:hypothetical protein B0H14DRAFT_2570566 [Mycena olivaceomarginata]
MSWDGHSALRSELSEQESEQQVRTFCDGNLFRTSKQATCIPTDIPDILTIRTPLNKSTVAITVWSVHITAILLCSPPCPLHQCFQAQYDDMHKACGCWCTEATTPALMLDSQVAVAPVIESDKTVPKELQKDLKFRMFQHEIPYLSTWFHDETS